MLASMIRSLIGAYLWVAAGWTLGAVLHEATGLPEGLGLAAGLLVAAGLIARIALPAIHRLVVAPEHSVPAREANATR
ncbi:MAG: hypothetical protein XU10_C0018G0006 [Chloroflexi bacterium CSP1-4]|nr:MAG: hypothetical protein XU10_C0018G0006 [Chloroflexi bacterium CSP1-4]